MPRNLSASRLTATERWLRTFGKDELKEAKATLLLGRWTRHQGSVYIAAAHLQKIKGEIGRRQYKRGYVEVRLVAIYALFLFSVLFALCAFRVCVMHGDDYLDAHPVTVWFGK